jgi:hypothetical protein
MRLPRAPFGERQVRCDERRALFIVDAIKTVGSAATIWSR